MTKMRSNHVIDPLLAFVLSLLSATVSAQDIPAPSLTIEPAYPAAGDSFYIVFSIYTPSASVGFWPWSHPSIDGTVIEIPFDRGCGFLCPGGVSYKSFRKQMPPLSAGTYTVRFIDTQILGEFTITIGAQAPVPAPVPVPGPNGVALTLLAMLLGLYAARSLAARIPPPARCQKSS